MVINFHDKRSKFPFIVEHQTLKPAETKHACSDFLTPELLFKAHRKSKAPAHVLSFIDFFVLKLFEIGKISAHCDIFRCFYSI